MGSGRDLSDEEMGQIKAFRSVGMSERQIAARIGRSKTVVYNFLASPENYASKRKGSKIGRPRALSERDS